MKYTTTKRFSQVEIGESFIEVLSPVNLTAIRIKAVAGPGGRVYNARRSNGGMIHMADWEPVLTDKTMGPFPRKD